MTDDADKPLDLWFVQRTLEYILRGSVESGEISLEGKTPDEVLSQLRDIVDSVIESNGENLFTSIDYRSTLLDRATAETDADNCELAVTLHAIWIEHFVNGLILRAFERMGHYEIISLPLIRELRLQTKITALWSLANLPLISDDSLRLIGQITEARNSFVHYKWKLEDADKIDERKRQVKLLAAKFNDVIAELHALESAFYWNGREAEIVDSLHEDVRKKRAEE